MVLCFTIPCLVSLFHGLWCDLSVKIFWSWNRLFRRTSRSVHGLAIATHGIMCYVISHLQNGRHFAITVTSYERNGVSNHRRLYCLLNRLFRRISKKTSKLRATGRCEGNPPATGGFPSQRASDAENLMTSSYIKHFQIHYIVWWLLYLIQISLKFVHKGPICNKWTLVPIMSWRQTGDKLVFEPMTSQFTYT